MISRENNELETARRRVEEACKDYIRAREASAHGSVGPEGPTTVVRVESAETSSIGLVVLSFPKKPALTGREDQVGRLVGHGLGNKGIGRELGVGAKTVQKHVERIKFKWGITTRAELARHAIVQLC